jgi:tripartite-type tricarboxylate transporter receptor subunit TctC
MTRSNVGASRRDILTLAAAAAGFALSARDAGAQSYPIRSVELLVGSNPGGPADFLTRLYAKAASKKLGQSFVVSNKPGAGGLIANDALFQAPADGYKLMATGPSVVTTLPLLKTDLRYNAVTDFEPIAMLGGGGFVMVASGKLGVSTVADFLKLAKSRKDPLFMASGGNAGSGHLCGGAFCDATGIAFSHIPYSGEAPGFTDLLGGQVDFMLTAPNVVAPHLKNPAVKVLAVTSTTRIGGFEQTPTMIEAGVPGFEYLGWIVLLARAGVPAPALEALRSVWTEAFANGEAVGEMEKLGMLTPKPYRDPASLTGFLASERDRTAKLIKKLGITA